MERPDRIAMSLPDELDITTQVLEDYRSTLASA